MPKFSFKEISDKIPTLKTFLESMPVGRVVASANGRVLMINTMAKRLLKSKKSQRWKKLASILKRTKKYTNGLVEDHPFSGRVIRFHTSQSVSRGKDFVICEISDVTEEWASEKQNDILEYTANIFAQPIPTDEWVRSVLQRTKVMMKLKDCTVFLYDSKASALSAQFSTNKKLERRVHVKSGKGIIGLSALKEKSILVPNVLKHKRYLGHLGLNAFSLVCIPMKVGNKLLGVFTVQDRPNKLISEQERIFYSILANRISITMDYRRVMDRLRTEYARLSAVITNSDRG